MRVRLLEVQENYKRELDKKKIKFNIEEEIKKKEREKCIKDGRGERKNKKVNKIKSIFFKKNLF